MACCSGVFRPPTMPTSPRFRKRGRWLIYVGLLDPGVVLGDPDDVPGAMSEIHPDRTVAQHVPLSSAVSIVRTMNRQVGPHGDSRPWRFVVRGPKHRRR